MDIEEAGIICNKRDVCRGVNLVINNPYHKITNQ